MSESKLFWNVIVVLERVLKRVLIRNQGAFLDILLKKNRHNTPHRLEFRKFCPYCYKHTIHGEIKK
ncbi:hypothetical protein RND81_O173700 [Saponaria officinalis]|uniref:Ribosomal protein L33 n=1 Tax=Saponaria officinalis TaxID=3572 RepID=A0AAW1GBX7_SAPOF